MHRPLSAAAAHTRRRALCALRSWGGRVSRRLVDLEHSKPGMVKVFWGECSVLYQMSMALRDCATRQRVFYGIGIDRKT